MSCAIDIPCFNPFASTFKETCYNNVEIISFNESIPKLRRQGDPRVLLSNISFTGSSNSFQDVITISLNNQFWFTNNFFGGSSQDDLIFFPNLQIGSIITIRQYPYPTAPGTLLPNGDYGIYEITNITTGAMTTLDVIFQSGTGVYLTSNFVGPTTISYLDCKIFIPVIPSVVQLNNPEGQELICSNKFKNCDYISSINFEDCLNFEYPNSGVFIKDLIYWNDGTKNYTTTPTDFFVGFTLKDGNDEDIIFTPECLGSICLIQKQQISEEVKCFKLKLLYLQCSYGTKVDKLIKKLKFGTDVTCELEELKNLKRALILLNNYDTRDIDLEDEIYNSFSYEQIKTILNKL
jgi:hypothetical protein